MKSEKLEQLNAELEDAAVWNDNLACFRPALVGNVRKGLAYRLTWRGSPTPDIEPLSTN